MGDVFVVARAGLEPATWRIEAAYSIQLSYRAKTIVVRWTGRGYYSFFLKLSILSHETSYAPHEDVCR